MRAYVSAPKKTRYIRFIVRTDHPSRLRCTGIVTSLRILGEEGKLSDYYVEYSHELLEKMNEGLPCPPFIKKGWSPDCISWSKDTPLAQEWISIFREIVAILEDSDVEVGTLITYDPGVIVYEDDYQVVANSRRY